MGNELTERPSFGLEEVQRGLLAIACANGNSRKAAKALAADKENGFAVSHQTLHRWKTSTYADEYQRTRAELLPIIQRETADAHRDLALRQLGLSKRIAKKLGRALEQDLSPRDLGYLTTAMRNVDVGTGIHTQNSQLLDGEPTEIRQHRSAEEVLRSLQAKGVVLNAEVVSEEDVTPPSQVSQAT